MSEFKDELYLFQKEIANFHLPRWEELPSIELYRDQVVIFIEDTLKPILPNDEKIITPAMINNYVKLKLIPSPNKKRYTKVHLAYLIVITLFKSVFSLQDIKYAISAQIDYSGEKEAYNLFCNEQELALNQVLDYALGNHVNAQMLEDRSFAPLRFASLSLSNRFIVQRVIAVIKNNL